MIKVSDLPNKTGHLALLGATLIPTILGYSVYLTDLPNGILRIVTNLRLIDHPDASQFYTFRPVLIPNMTLDSWGLLFGPWMGAENATSLLVAISMLLLYTAVQALRAATVGTTSLLVGAISLLVIQSGVFRWGLVNYEVGIGIALWLVALTELHERQGELGAARHVALRSTLAVAAVMSSIFPVVLLACHAASRWLLMLRKEGRVWSWEIGPGLCCPLLVTAVFLAVAQKKPPGSGLDTEWTLYGKVSGWVSLFYVRGPGLELPLALAIGAAVLLLLATMHGRLDRRLQLCVVLMVLVQLAAPSRLFSVDAVDYRLAEPIALVALAGLTFSLRGGRVWRAWGRSITFAFMVLAAAKPLVSIRSLQPVRDLRAELTADMEAVPAGAMLLVATDLPDFRFSGHRIWHLLLLSVADLGRDIYTPSLFNNFFTHEKRTDLDMPDWIASDELLTTPATCVASHAVIIGDVEKVAQLAAAVPAAILSQSAHAAALVIDRPQCVARAKAQGLAP